MGELHQGAEGPQRTVVPSKKKMKKMKKKTKKKKKGKRRR